MLSNPFIWTSQSAGRWVLNCCVNSGAGMVLETPLVWNSGNDVIDFMP